MEIQDCINAMCLTSYSKDKMRFLIMPVSLLVNPKPICYTEEGVKEEIIYIQSPQVKCRLLKI